MLFDSKVKQSIEDERGQSWTGVDSNGHVCTDVPECATIVPPCGKIDKDGRSIGASIRVYIAEHIGIFTNLDIDRECGLSTRREKKARSEALRRLEKEGKIKKIENKPGHWRSLDYQKKVISFEPNKKPEPFSLPFPLGIGDLAKIYPGNIILLSGMSNSGKTGFILQTLVHALLLYTSKSIKSSIKKQLLCQRIQYMTSELEVDEILEWGNTFNFPIHEHVTFIDRNENFHDIINPDGINVVDYIEIYDKFYDIGRQIAEIHDSLNKGIAIIAIQKKEGATYGLGGQFSIWKARLAINLEKTFGNVMIAKLAKVKVPIDYDNNPEGKEIDYIVSKESGLKPLTEWRYMDIKERKVQNKIYKEQGIRLPRKKTARYQYSIMRVNGEYSNIDNNTVEKWVESFGDFVPSELSRMEERSEMKPFLKGDGWYHQLSTILQKSAR